MYPHERSLVSKMADKPFVLLGVNTDTSREVVKKAQADEHLTWRSFWNGGQVGPISNAWHIQGYPTLFIIDHKGVIRNRYLGAPPGDTLDKEIEKLVQEAEKG
jgi:hypothetical protein